MANKILDIWRKYSSPVFRVNVSFWADDELILTLEDISKLKDPAN